MNEPLVDVCMPTYEPKAAMLREALHSVLAQTEQRWLLWLRDDGSKTIDVKPAVNDLLSDERMRYIQGYTNEGIGANWNNTVHLGSAPYVAFLFQDDKWDPQYLERTLKMFEQHPNVGMVVVNHRYNIEGDIVTAQEYRDLEEWRTANLKDGLQDRADFLWKWIDAGLCPNLIGEPCFVMLKREAMNRVGQFHNNMAQALDAEYWVRMLNAYDWAFVREKSGFFRVHEEGTTARNRREGKGLFDRFRILQALIDRLPRGAARRRAQKAQITQFEEMLRKYLHKKDRGDRITYGGGSVLKKFALSHPFVVLKGVIRAFTQTAP